MKIRGPLVPALRSVSTHVQVKFVSDLQVVGRFWVTSPFQNPTWSITGPAKPLTFQRQKYTYSPGALKFRLRSRKIATFDPQILPGLRLAVAVTRVRKPPDGTVAP